MLKSLKSGVLQELILIKEPSFGEQFDKLLEALGSPHCALVKLRIDNCPWPKERQVSDLLEALTKAAEDSTLPPQLRTLEMFDMETGGGELPARFFEVCGPKLEKLGLGRLGLTGCIPGEIGKLNHVKSIILHDNEMSGELPAELGGCVALRKLIVFGNKFSGTLPKELQACAELEDLRIRPKNDDLSDPPEDSPFFEPTAISRGGREEKKTLKVRACQLVGRTSTYM